LGSGRNLPGTYNINIKSPWNKKDALTLRYLREWAGLSPEDCDRFVEEWSKKGGGQLRTHREITQENVKAFTVYLRRKIIETCGSNGLDDYIKFKLKEKGVGV
jgi:hypothetical protein